MPKKRNMDPECRNAGMRVPKTGNDGRRNARMIKRNAGIINIKMIKKCINPNPNPLKDSVLHVTNPNPTLPFDSRL